MNKLLLGLPVLLLPLGLSALPRAPFVSQEHLARIMPGKSLAYVEGPGVADLLEQGLEHPFLAAVLDSELARAALAQAPMSPEEALAWADAYLGRPVLPTLSKLASKGVALSAGLKRGKPAFGLALRGEDPALLREALDGVLVKLAEQYGVEEERLREPHDEVRGVDVWYLGDELALGVSNELLLASNDEGVLRDMIDLGAAEGDSLADDQGFQSARAKRRPDATLWGWMDVDAIESETPGGGDKLRAMTRDPGVHFLLGPAIAALGSSSELAAELALGDESLALSVKGIGIDAGPAQSVLFPAGASAPALPRASETDGGTAMLYRDLAGLFRQRTELFPADVLPKFSEAISNLAFLFGGGDITDDVLPSLSPWLGLVVRDPVFRPGALPDIELPGAAVLLRTNEPEKIGERLIAGFQSLIGFVNIDGAQKARQPMLLDIELSGGVKISSAHFTTPPEGEGVDMRYNLEPACAMVGDTFVLGTHVSLVRSIADQLQRGEIAERPPGREGLTLSGPVVARTVHENAEALVMNAVLNEGKTMEVARGEVDGLEKLARMIRALEFETVRTAENELCVSVAIGLAEREER